MAWCNCIQFSDLFDFSGYSDMAIGLGRMFGFYFLENFNFPYMSKTITEFWRRWHISLSSWFREYVYIPLGGNRKGLARQLFNIMVVWMLTGLWHGANWNFVLWGVYYGVLLMIEKLFLLKWLDKLPNLDRAYLQHVSRDYWMDDFCTDRYSSAGGIFKDNVWNRTCCSCGL